MPPVAFRGLATALVGLAAALLPCAPAHALADNILILVADDMGPELVAAYNGPGTTAITPRLDALAQQGVLFRNAWGYSRCSPTRATLLTGKYGFHTGVGSNVNVNLPGWTVQVSETTLPERLAATHATACFGKWHLATAAVGGDLAPNLAGYAHFAGFIQPLRDVEGYFEFDKVVDGATVHVVNYRATEIVDDAIAWIASVPEPWLCVVNFDNPHGPYHTPPRKLHSFRDPLTDDDQLHAMVEAMDTEIGRLLDSLAPESLAHTTTIFLGDNGVLEKGTLYQGGIRVPFIVSGSAVTDPGRETLGLVDTVDVYASVARIVGLGVSGLGLDSVSFKPYLDNEPAGSPAWSRTRVYSFSERFAPNGQIVPPDVHRAVRDDRYKLIRRPTYDEFYDLRNDPKEELDLLSAPGLMSHPVLMRYQNLSVQLNKILGT